MTLIPLAALIVAHESDTPDPRIPQAVLILGAALAIFSLLILLIEALRPPRLKGSRGVFGLFSGLLLIGSALLVPFIAAYFSIKTDTAAVTPVALAVPSPTYSGAPTAEGTPGLNSEQRQRASALFRAIGKVVTDEITIEPAALDQSLQEGTPLAQIVTDHGGSVDQVVNGISEIMKQGIRDSVARGEMNSIQAALILSQMNNFIRLAVNSNLNTLGQRLGGPTPDPNATLDPMFSFAAEATAEVTSEVIGQPDGHTVADAHADRYPHAAPNRHALGDAVPLSHAHTHADADRRDALCRLSAVQSAAAICAHHRLRHTGGDPVWLHRRTVRPGIGQRQRRDLVVHDLSRAGRLGRWAVHAGQRRLRHSAAAKHKLIHCYTGQGYKTSYPCP